MPKHRPAPAGALAIHPNPTPFEGLNTVLNHLVTGAREALGEAFVGAYLIGSFAVGDADGESDCDFMIVTARDATPEEQDRLQALHAAIHELPILPWRHRLEGSYAPARVLRRWSESPRDPPGEPPRPTDWADPGTSGRAARAYPFLFLDHGAKRLIRSEHDNSQVVRWQLREKGITLAGPPPRSLVDPVRPEALKAEVRETMRWCAAMGLEPLDVVGDQSFWVLLYCRMLHTLATGRIASKKVAATWAGSHLDPRWAGLIERAQATRDAPRERFMDPADPVEVEATRAFAAYALTQAERTAPRKIPEPPRHGPPGRHDPRFAGGRSWTPPTVRPGGRGRRG